MVASREQLGLGYLRGCNEAKVSSFVRVALAANMQKFKELLADCWTFSVAFDSATVEGSSLFDIRIRFAFKGRLFCFHLLSLPMDVLFKTLQGKHLLVQQQINAFDIFNSRLRELTHLVGPLTSVQVQAFEPSVRSSPFQLTTLLISSEAAVHMQLPKLRDWMPTLLIPWSARSESCWWTSLPALL